MMKLLVLLLCPVLSWGQGAGDQTYCAFEKCLVPLLVSCEELLRNYDFQGSCCRLVDLVATGGCRIEVGSKGNCFWSPKCGPCDPEVKCNIEYFTDTSEECPVLDYDALDPVTALNPPSPSPPPVELPANETHMPSFFPTTGPTCTPTAAPVEPTFTPTMLPVLSGSMPLGKTILLVALVATTIYSLF